MISPENSPLKIVWFSEIKWNYLKTRKQQIIEHFPENWEVLFIESYVAGKSNHFLPRKEGKVVHATIPFFKSTPNKIVNHIQNNKISRFCFQIVSYLWVTLLLCFTGFSTKNKVICISNVYYATIIKYLRKKLVVYDCNDVPMGFSSSLNFTELYFRKTLTLADLTITVSKKLVEKIQFYQKTDIPLIGNGVDYELFSKASFIIPDDIKPLPSPRIMYAGALADWFDVDLVLRIAESCKDGSVILIGPYLSASLKNRLDDKKYPNIFYLGIKLYIDLPSYYHHSDVCIIPFKKNELTNGLNPNKMYEYLASGKAVVTRDFSDEIEALAGDIYVARNDDEFVSFIGRALNEPVNKERLQSIAEQNSWKSKSRQFVDLINRSLAEKHKLQ